MDNINCFKNFSESIQDYRKLVFLMFSIRNDGHLIKNCGYLKKLFIVYTKLRNWVNVVSLLYGKTLKTSMVDKKIDETEAFELKKI